MTTSVLPQPVADMSPILRSSGTDWTAVLQPTCGLLVVERGLAVSGAAVTSAKRMLETPLLIACSIEQLPEQLTSIPEELAADIAALAGRFAGLMKVDSLRIRLEVVAGDACRKWHVDHTDLRLVVTYGGPGTRFRRSEDGPVEEVPLQHIALFKGRCSSDGDVLVHHRSPPISGTGVRRLLLVIDTPDQGR